MEASALRAPALPAPSPGSGPLWRLRSDDQLVALFRKGDDEAFRAIHDRYRPRLLAYTRQMLGGSRADAEDALQDVFVRAYDALRRDQRPVALRAWLYRVAHNRCIDQLRCPAPVPRDVLDVSRRAAPDPPAEAERHDELKRVVCDIGRLPEQQRSALLMREIDGLCYADIADALGVGVEAVKSLLVRARMGLAEGRDARDTACADIRADLTLALDRGVRMSGRARRHLRDCPGCREYRLALRGLRGRLDALFPSHGALTALAELLGIGGAGTGAAVGAGSSAGGGTIAAGTIAAGAPIAAKITVLVCAGAAAAGVAAVHRPVPRVAATPAAHRAAPARHPRSHAVSVAAAVARPARRPPVASPSAHAPAPAASGHEPAAVARPGRIAFAVGRDRPFDAHRIAAPSAPGSRTTARRTGGALAPDALAPADTAAAPPPPVADAHAGATTAATAPAPADRAAPDAPADAAPPAEAPAAGAVAPAADDAPPPDDDSPADTAPTPAP